MKFVKRRLLAALMATAVSATLFALPASAEGADSSATSTETSGISLYDEYDTYMEAVADYSDAKKADEIVILAGNKDAFTAEGCGDYVYVENMDVLKDYLSQETENMDVLVWKDNTEYKQQGTVTYKFTVPTTALYTVEFKYLPLVKTKGTVDNVDDKTSTSPVELGLFFDEDIASYANGKAHLYAGLDAFKLPRNFVNNGASLEQPYGEIRVDGLDNQLTPEQVQFADFCTAYATDSSGVEPDPYKILLTAGEHTVTLKSIYEPFALASITFKAPENPISYSDYYDTHSDKPNYSGEAIEIEGEHVWIKSTNSIVSKSDNSSADVTPHDPVKTILNYIGSTNWQVPGDSLTWVIDVPESGLYTLGMNYKQSAVIDGFSYRALTIDGEIPFEECKSLSFGYCTSWKFWEFGDGENPYLFYLSEGKHTIQFTVTLGETAEFYKRLSEIVEEIGDKYIEIVMITGDSPDPNRDYDLFKQIKDLQDVLLSTHEDITVLAEDMKILSGSRSNKYISALDNMARVLKNMYDNPYTAQNYLSDYYNNYTTVCSWLYEMKTMPLSVDQIQFASAEKGFKDNHSGFFETFGFEFQRFCLSFSDNFSTIGGAAEVGDKGSIRIWVNWGRDQCQVLSNLIQESFSVKTGISVELEIVDASLIKGILAGNFPDLSLHLSRTDPVNLGMRGALYDLSNFSASIDPEKYSTVDDGVNFSLDYETVLKRFQDSADIPYWYNNSEGSQLFALPDTQGFFIMFYRTDVFENLDIEDPKNANGGLGWTWDDYIEAATILQRNNMKAFIPYTKIASTTAVNAGMGSLNLFPTFLTQNSVKLYNDEHNKTTLTSSEAIAAFTQWTDLYTKYGIDKQADFYNRFRVGIMPLGISSYTLYTQLNQAAPEIQGRWTIAEIPGVPTYNEDGTIASINRSIGGSGTGCSVVAPSTNKDGAWQFLCWWTSAETQLRYNNNVESILGTVSRTATANKQAFESYSWNVDDLDILKSQWSQVEELPEVPGGYYVSRAVDQAYWAVLNGESNEKDAMLEWGEVADNEIIRKISEYER